MEKLTTPIGSRFGRWVVVANAGMDARRNTLWECRCICGHIRIARACIIKKDPVLTCNGNHEWGGKLPPGVAAMNAMYAAYRGRAAAHDHVFELSVEQFEHMTTQDCFYCGVEPKQIYRSRNANGGYTYNGIDRKDSKQGYTLDNCVPCCWQCNKIKSIMPYEKFMEWIHRIAAHQTANIKNEQTVT